MTNIGTLDRGLRLFAGAALLIAPFAMAEALAPLGNWRYALAAAGLVMVGTALTRFCPAYALLGIRTCKA